MACKKIIIIGAPRSGTNMLRDVLTSFKGLGSWPCDEINYIWRHGNVSYSSDEIPSALATKRVKKYIRNQFEKLAHKKNIDCVVEKTCANSLRVPFVNEVLPDAKYIFIYRDGVDAVGSAKLRWTANLELSYILQKVRFVPKADLPYYAIRYLWSRAYKLFSKEKRLAFWGPALDGMDKLLEQHSLNEVCALQWQRCVDKAEEAFVQMPQEQVIKIKYERFVSSPKEELTKILDFVNYNASEEAISHSVLNVSDKNVGKGREMLGADEVSQLETLIGSSLKRYGYL